MLHSVKNIFICRYCSYRYHHAVSLNFFKFYFFLILSHCSFSCVWQQRRQRNMFSLKNHFYQNWQIYEVLRMSHFQRGYDFSHCQNHDLWGFKTTIPKKYTKSVISCRISFWRINFFDDSFLFAYYNYDVSSL